VIFQGFEDGIKDILCAKPVVAPDEILKPLFPKHVLVAVSSFPNAIRANRDHMTRTPPGAGRDRISSGLGLNYFRMHSQIYNPSKFFRMISSGTEETIRTRLKLCIFVIG